MTPTKASEKKTSSKTFSDDLKALDNKWSQRFGTLETMLLAKSFSVPVELVKQMSITIVTTERPLKPPLQSVNGTSSVQTTGMVTQVFSSQHLTGNSS